MMLFRSACAIVLVSLLSSLTYSQVRPGRYVEVGPGPQGFGVYQYEMTPGLAFALREFWSFSGRAIWHPDVLIDPRDGRVWGVQPDVAGTRADLVELTLQGNTVVLGQRVPLPPGNRFELSQLRGHGFDDQNRLVLAGAQLVWVVDIDTTQYTTHLVRDFVIDYYFPSRAGRKAVVTGWWHGVDWAVASINADGTTDQVFYREPSVPYPVTQSNRVYTTITGRTFLTVDTGTGNHPWFAELDYSTGRLIEHFPAGVYPKVRQVVEDPVRNVLYISGWMDFLALNRAVIFDLATNQVTQVWRTTGLALTSKVPAWYPQNHLNIHPKNPTAGSTFRATWTMGGEPMDPVLIYFHRAIISGVPIN